MTKQSPSRFSGEGNVISLHATIISVHRLTNHIQPNHSFRCLCHSRSARWRAIGIETKSTKIGPKRKYPDVRLNRLKTMLAISDSKAGSCSTKPITETYPSTGLYPNNQRNDPISLICLYAGIVTGSIRGDIPLLWSIRRARPSIQAQANVRTPMRS